jgi:dethiobiotin synthetase
MTGIADRPERFACFITGTDTGVGKTHATATLLHALHGAGYSTVGMKPIAAGGEWLDDQWQNDDVDQLRAAGSVIVPQEEMCPFFFARRYRRTWPPRSKARALRPSRFAMHSSLRQRAEAVVVEGVGGFIVPLDMGAARWNTADLAVMLDLPVIMVVGIRLGCLSHAMLTAEAIRARGLRLAGWIANRIDPDMLLPSENIVTLQDALGALDAPLLGELPWQVAPAVAASTSTSRRCCRPRRPLSPITVPRRIAREVAKPNPLPNPIPIMTQQANQTVATISAEALRQSARNIAAAAPKEGDAWRVDDVAALFALPFNDLLFRAQQVHREHFDANTVQLSTLLSIKTGGCEEDCGYCPQSAHHDAGVKAEKLMDLEAVLDAAKAAKANGATRFCMGAAWREPKDATSSP